MQIICNKLRDCLMPADKQNQTVSVTNGWLYVGVCLYEIFYHIHVVRLTLR